MNARLVAPLLGLTVAAVVLAGCTGSGKPTAAATTPGTPGSTVTTTVTPSSPASSSAPGSSSNAPTASASSTASSRSTSGGTTASSTVCTESQLRASVVPGIGGDGHQGVELDFLNKAASSCTMQGYPGAAILDSSGRQVKQATRTPRGFLGGLPIGTNTPPTITVPAGGKAKALIEGISIQETGAAQAGCQSESYPKILVTPPNTKIPVPFDVSWPVCESFEIHPVTLTS